MINCHMWLWIMSGNMFVVYNVLYTQLFARKLIAFVTLIIYYIVILIWQVIYIVVTNICMIWVSLFNFVSVQEQFVIIWFVVLMTSVDNILSRQSNIWFCSFFMKIKLCNGWKSLKIYCWFIVMVISELQTLINII